jgi:hypothetical protein
MELETLEQTTKEESVATTTKICADCGKWLSVKQFSKHPMSRDGYKAVCKKCFSKKLASRKGRSITEFVEHALQPVEEAPQISPTTSAQLQLITNILHDALIGNHTVTISIPIMNMNLTFNQ